MDTFVANPVAWEAGWGRSAHKARLFDDVTGPAAGVKPVPASSVKAAADADEGTGDSGEKAQSRAERKVERKQRWLAERAAAAAASATGTHGEGGAQAGNAAAVAASLHMDPASAALMPAAGGKPAKESKARAKDKAQHVGGGGAASGKEARLSAAVAQALAAVGGMRG
jgi:hypothetical protein